MVFPSVPVYLDPPNWQQQHRGANDNSFLPPQPTPVGGGTTGLVKPSSMTDRARLAKIPQPEAALKCPRCGSTNTKFCYFNNYSLTQPRHFCKTCRRYWTRGGALRNVPVGGGCRRNKRSKGSNSRPKSPAGSSPSSAFPPKSGTNDITGHMPPTPSQLPILPPLHHLLDYNSRDMGINFGTILPPVETAVGATSGTDMEFHIGTSTSGGGPMLSSGLVEQWRFQQVQQFPFLANLEPPTGTGLFSFENEAGIEPPSYVDQLRSKPLDHGFTELANVKMEDNQALNLSRNFLGISGSDQIWSGNAWTDLSTFTSPSTGHFL